MCRLYAKIGGSTRTELLDRARRLGLAREPLRGGLQRRTLKVIQRRILELMRHDLRVVDLSRMLKRTPRLVQSELYALRQSFGVRDNLALVDAAIRAGLLKGAKPEQARNPLTVRECEILDGLYSGLPARMIAEGLGLSKSNVSSRIRILKDKLNVETIDELLDEVERRGLYPSNRKRPQRVSRSAAARRRPRSAQVLTLRALEVLLALASQPPTTHANIAHSFGISKGAVDQYSVLIQRRLGARSKREALRRAREIGLLPGPREKIPLYEKLGLSQRQYDVLCLLAHGLSPDRIAKRLKTNIRVVHLYTRTAVFALGATSPEDAVRIARKRGLFEKLE